MSQGQQHAIEDDQRRGGGKSCYHHFSPPPRSSSIACCWPWLISLVYGAGLLFRGPFCITMSLKNNNYNYYLHLTLSFAWNSELFHYELAQFPFISEISRHYWAREDTETYYEPANCGNYVPENHWSVQWKWTKQSAKSYGRNCRRNS